MKNINGKDYVNKHPDESKASQVASVLGKPIGIFKKFQETIKDPLGRKILGGNIKFLLKQSLKKDKD